MFDLYIVATPCLALIAILTLINLKLTLRQPRRQLIIGDAVTNSRIKHRRAEAEQSTTNNNSLNSPLLKTLLYLIKNHTLLELIVIRRARNKVPILLSLMVQLALIHFLEFAFYFSAAGIIVSLTVFIVKFVADYRKKTQENNQTEKQKKKEKNQVRNQCKLQIFMTTLSLLINMVLCWIFYKNFHNQLIIKHGINLAIIFAIDHFAVKPFTLALMSLPLSFSDHVIQFIEKENQIVEMLHENRIRKARKSTNEEVKNPQRIFVSTSQTENTLEIEPYVNLDPHQKVLQTLHPRKKIELQKIIPARKRPSKQYNGDNSSLSLFDHNLPLKQPTQMIKKAQNFKSAQKNLNTSPPIKQKIDEINNASFLKKKNNIYTQTVDFIDESKIPEQNKKRKQNQQNQDPLKNLQIKTPKSVKFLKEIKFSNSAKKAFERSNEDYSNRKNQFQKNQSQIFQKTQQINDQNRSNRSHGSNFYGSAGKNDLLKIYEDKFAQDLGQIDANSPYRKRRNPLECRINEVNSKQNQSNVSKKFSLDPSKNMNTSHFPDYLQKTYIQESYEKKRRSFHHVSDLNLSRRSDAFSKHSNDSRISKSFKRTVRTKDPIVRENDENRVPQFIIEDFTY